MHTIDLIFPIMAVIYIAGLTYASYNPNINESGSSTIFFMMLLLPYLLGVLTPRKSEIIDYINKIII